MANIERRRWTCPSCNRAFKILVTAADPKLCPDCLKQGTRAGSRPEPVSHFELMSPQPQLSSSPVIQKQAPGPLQSFEMINADAASRPVSRPHRQSTVGAAVLYGVSAAVLLAIGGGIYLYTQSSKKAAQGGVKSSANAATATGSRTSTSESPVVQTGASESRLHIHLSARMDNGEVREPENLSVAIIPLTNKFQAEMQELYAESELMAAQVRTATNQLVKDRPEGVPEIEVDAVIEQELRNLERRLRDHAATMTKVLAAGGKSRAVTTSRMGTIEIEIPEGKYVLISKIWQDSNNPLQFDGADRIRWCVVFETTGKSTNLSFDQSRAVPQSMSRIATIGEKAMLKCFGVQFARHPEDELRLQRQEALQDNLWHMVNEIDLVEAHQARHLKEFLENPSQAFANLPDASEGSAEFNKLSEEDRQRLVRLVCRAVKTKQPAFNEPDHSFWEKQAQVRKLTKFLIAMFMKSHEDLKAGGRTDEKLQMEEYVYQLDQLPTDVQKRLLGMIVQADEKGFNTLSVEDLRYLLRYPGPAWGFKKHMQTARTRAAKGLPPGKT